MVIGDEKLWVVEIVVVELIDRVFVVVVFVVEVEVEVEV